MHNGKEETEEKAPKWNKKKEEQDRLCMYVCTYVCMYVCIT